MAAIEQAWFELLLGLVGIGAVLSVVLKLLRQAGGGLR